MSYVRGDGRNARQPEDARRLTRASALIRAAPCLLGDVLPETADEVELPVAQLCPLLACHTLSTEKEHRDDLKATSVVTNPPSDRLLERVIALWREVGLQGVVKLGVVAEDETAVGLRVVPDHDPGTVLERPRAPVPRGRQACDRKKRRRS